MLNFNFARFKTLFRDLIPVYELNMSFLFSFGILSVYITCFSVRNNEIICRKFWIRKRTIVEYVGKNACELERIIL